MVELKESEWLPAVLALLAMLGFLGTIYMPHQYELRESSRDIVMVLMGVMAGVVKDVYSYFFGSSAKGNSAEN